MEKQFYFEIPNYKDMCKVFTEHMSYLIKDIMLSKVVRELPEKVEIADHIKELNKNLYTASAINQSLRRVIRSRIRNLQEKCLHESTHEHPTGLCDWVCDICGAYSQENGYSGQGKVSDWYDRIKPDEDSDD